MMSEMEISEGCRRGDSAAWRELYVRYAGRLLAIALRYTGDRETAEDVLHDVFISVYGSFGKFSYRGEGSLFAWLSRVMTNAALEYMRKKRTVDLVAIESIADEVEEDVAERDAERVPQPVLMQFISELPDGYRTVFNLYTFEGRSHKEIADLLGINERSSSSQLSRAKSLLAKKIRNYLCNEK